MSDKRPGYEEERDFYKQRAAEKQIDSEAKRMQRAYEAKRHPCNQEPCACACIRCVQARKYNQPHTHCRGR